MTVDQICKHPVLILYWVALKKGIPLKEWAEIMRENYGTRIDSPLLDAVLIVEEYGTENPWRNLM